MNSDAGLTSFFGKLPSRGDFIRGGPQGPAEEALASWLSAMVEYSRGDLPVEALRFQLCVPAERALVGAWVPSQDEVGRLFPLAAMREVPAELLATSWSVLPSYYAEFLAELQDALVASKETGELLASTLEQPRTPHPSEMPAMLCSVRDSLAACRSHAFAQRVFGDDAVRALLYAVGTLERAVALGDESIVVDLPIRSSVELFVWQEMISVLSDAAVPRPALIWSSTCDRALACFGQPSEQVLAFLLNPEHRSSRRWPLWTDNPAALEIVESSLNPSVLRAVEDDLPMPDVLKVMSDAKN